MKKLRLAIIGQGRSGRNIHGAFYKSADNAWFDVVAVVEADSARRELALVEYPGCEAYASYSELFCRRDIDVVVNASYSEQHYAITKDLLEHGFNVLVEKPLAASYYECQTLIRLAGEKGVTLAVFMQTFFAPFYKLAVETIKSGILGNIEQVSIRYNGLARRWDWQTLQCKTAGGVYNTGPHPIGMALGFLDYDENARVVYSRLSRNLTSGDSDDYAKIIMTAPGRPVVDVEISSIDAYCDYNVKLQGSRGTLKCTAGGAYKMKYIVDGENEPRPVVRESLKDKDGMPIYCSERLIMHEKEGQLDGTAFDVGTRELYKALYEKLTTGKAMPVTAETGARVIGIIEKVHADNPLELEFL